MGIGNVGKLDVYHTLRPWEDFIGILKDLQISDDGETLLVEFYNSITFNFFIQGEDEFIKRITKIPKDTKIGILRTEKDLRVRVVDDDHVILNMRNISPDESFPCEKCQNRMVYSNAKGWYCPNCGWIPPSNKRHQNLSREEENK